MSRKGGGRRLCLRLACALALCLFSAVGSVSARTLEEALVSTFPGVLREDGQGLAAVFSRTVAASFPVTGTSSSHVYRFNPAGDTFERLKVPLGPVFSERAETVGRRTLSVGVNYPLLDYAAINGRDLDALISNDPGTGGDYIAICPPCEPVLGVARLDLEAQIG